MSGALDQLLVVQDLDTAITQLQHRRAALPERSGLTGLEVELAGYAAEKVALMGRRAELMATQKDLEGQIAVVTERRTGIEQRMYAARGSSTRDLQAMDEEVRHLTQRQSQLEELELVAMVDQEPIDAELAQLSERSAPIEERVAVLRAEVEAGAGRDRPGAGPSHTRPGQPRRPSFPPALADRYEKLRTRMRGVAAARLIGHRCDGCHQELSAVEVDRIRAMPADTVVTCDLCGRILVPV